MRSATLKLKYILDNIPFTDRCMQHLQYVHTDVACPLDVAKHTQTGADTGVDARWLRTATAAVLRSLP